MMIVWPEVMYDAAEFRALDEFLTLPKAARKIDSAQNCHVPRGKTIPKNRLRVINSKYKDHAGKNSIFWSKIPIL